MPSLVDMAHPQQGRVLALGQCAARRRPQSRTWATDAGRTAELGGRGALGMLSMIATGRPQGFELLETSSRSGFQPGAGVLIDSPPPGEPSPRHAASHAADLFALTYSSRSTNCAIILGALQQQGWTCRCPGRHPQHPAKPGNHGHRPKHSDRASIEARWPGAASGRSPDGVKSRLG